MKNIAVFVSGSGTNLENIIRHFEHSDKGRVVLTVSNRADAYALVRSRNLGVPSIVINKQQLGDADFLLNVLGMHNVDFIVLAGFLLMAPKYLIEAYPHRIINLHPALLPKFGGKGMYGHHVHEAVKAAGETEPGITIHYVSEVCDGGEIIEQFRTPLADTDSIEDIEQKIHVLEQTYFPGVIEQVIKN